MKKLLSLFIVLFWLTSFWYCVDSYTCSYKWIVNDVARNWISTTYYSTNCNNFWPYYDCNIYVDISTSNWNCYQIWWFDLSYYDDINLNVEMGWNYISFSKNYNNLDQLNGYTVCSPSRLMIQGRVYAYVSDLPFTVVSFPESALTNYSYTYTCPTCQECQECQECPSCPSVNTWEMLSGYILESEITPWYCETRFNLISPSDCPNSSWSWDIQRSSFRVNNFQVMGGRNIYLYIPEWLNRDYTYVDENLQIEVENEGDEEYIQGIIDINSYRPSSEDFTNIFVSGLTLIMPYIVVALFIIFVWKLIKKIFR